MNFNDFLYRAMFLEWIEEKGDIFGKGKLRAEDVVGENDRHSDSDF